MLCIELSAEFILGDATNQLIKTIPGMKNIYVNMNDLLKVLSHANCSIDFV
jgi:hypothetical protein